MSVLTDHQYDQRYTRFKHVTSSVERLHIHILYTIGAPHIIHKLYFLSTNTQIYVMLLSGRTGGNYSRYIGRLGLYVNIGNEEF